MRKILVRSLLMPDGRELNLQLVEADDDGKVLSVTPFETETPSTQYIAEPMALTDDGDLLPRPLLQAYKTAISRLDKLGAFHNIGAQAYKPGLEHILTLDAALGKPSQKIKTIHVAGTNGKGSTASTIAAVLTAAGYKTGLYTSPHLLDFRERIRIDGKMITRADVVNFVNRFDTLDLDFTPSYFETLTAMAFDYFAHQKVDVAVIEVGLGGRLDSTNIITPILSVITNISLDHTAILGDTEPQIAAEKAGIIKPGVPVVVGRAEGDVRTIFEQVAAQNNAPVIFAQDNRLFATVVEDTLGNLHYEGTPWGNIAAELSGRCQIENTATILNSLVILSEHFDINAANVREGFANVRKLSGLQGRWMRITHNDHNFVCDTGHNPDAWRYLGAQLDSLRLGSHLHMIVGFLRDKDLDTIVRYMPKDAEYIFVAPDSDRARSAEETATIFAAHGINGRTAPTLIEAITKLPNNPSDLIFVGGSTFLTSQLLSFHS